MNEDQVNEKVKEKQTVSTSVKEKKRNEKGRRREEE